MRATTPSALSQDVLIWSLGANSPAAKMAEERTLHENKLAKMEAEMKMVFQQKVNEKEAKLKQSEEELYARHREMKAACVQFRTVYRHIICADAAVVDPYRLEQQREDLLNKKSRLESGRPLTPEKAGTKKKVRCWLCVVSKDMAHANGLLQGFLRT